MNLTLRNGGLVQKALSAEMDDAEMKLLLVVLCASAITQEERYWLADDQTPVVFDGSLLHVNPTVELCNDAGAHSCIPASRVADYLVDFEELGILKLGMPPAYEPEVRKGELSSSMRRPSSVYVMKSGEGFVKIGISFDPEARLRSLVASYPFDVALVWHAELQNRRLAKDVEKEAHRVLKFHRTAGEWFEIDADMAVRAVKHIIAEMAQ